MTMDDDLDPLKRPRHPRPADTQPPLAAPAPIASPPAAQPEQRGEAPAEPPPRAAEVEPRIPRFAPAPPRRSPWRWGVAAAVLMVAVLAGVVWRVIDINRHAAALESVSHAVHFPADGEPPTAAAPEPAQAPEPSAVKAASAPDAAPPLAKPASRPAAVAAATRPARAAAAAASAEHPHGSVPPSKPVTVAGPPDPQAACSRRTPFWTTVCLQARCATDLYRGHATCSRLRQQEEQRRLEQELGG